MTFSSIVQLISFLSKVKELKNCVLYQETGKTVRVDIPQNNLNLRDQTTGAIFSLFGSREAKIDPKRPYDIKLIKGGFTILVKPRKGAQKTASSARYGALAKLDFSAFDISNFSDVSSSFVSSSKLVNSIKEASDVKCVSDFNDALEPYLDNSFKGVTLSLGGYTFKNVLGCIPVTNGEPKADVVLVCRRGQKLIPDCYLSYKMGRDAKGFQNYSGLSEKSSSYIFNHPETLEFYTKLHMLSKANKKEEVYQIIKDKKIIGMSVWGMDYGKGGYGVNNCHMIAQGEIRISGKRATYSHVNTNGDFSFDKTYQPVFGARYASGRNNKGPDGMNADNFRIGIFPRAYRSAWL